MLVFTLQVLAQSPTKGAFRLSRGLQDGLGLLADGSRLGGSIKTCKENVENGMLSLLNWGGLHIGR